MIKYITDIGYKVWMWMGTGTGYLIRYSKERDKSIKNAREALEQAFTPEIKKMLEDSNVK